MSGKSEKETISRHKARLAVWGAYVTILGTVVGLVFMWCQIRIAREEAARARRAEPLAYTLEAVDTHYEYEIQRGGQIFSVPAPSMRLQVTHGSLHAI